MFYFWQLVFAFFGFLEHNVLVEVMLVADEKKKCNALLQGKQQGQARLVSTCVDGAQKTTLSDSKLFLQIY